MFRNFKLILVLLAFPYLAHSQAAEPKIKWKFKTEGPIRAAAVIDEDKIFFGNSSGELYSLQLDSGVLLWQFQTGGAIAASPVIAEEKILLNSRDGHIYALDKNTGNLRWKFAKGPLSAAAYGGWEYFAASPVIAGDMVYCGAGDGHLYALDINTGQVRWKYATEARIRAAPLVSDGIIYQPSNDGFVHVLQSDSGSLLWKFATDGAAYDSRQFGFDRNSIYDQPSLEKDLLVFGSRDGNIYAVDVKSREAQWKFTYGPTWAMATTVENGTVYVGWSTNNLTCAIDLETGKEKWKFQCGAHVYTRPIVVGNSVYVGSADGKLYRLHKDTGALIWDYSIGSEIYGSPIHQDDTFFFGSDDGFFYALEEAPAALKAVFQPDSIAGISRYLIVDPQITPYLSENGFEQLDSAGLYRFVQDRIQDQRPSVIVFALPLIPSNIIGEDPQRGLIRQYLETGGKLVWMGDIPNYYALDSSGNFSRSPAAGEQLLGIKYAQANESGNYYSRPTREGLNRGLPAWLKTTAAIIAPGEGIIPLAYDEYGRISIWEKQFHPRPGSGFVSSRTWSWNVPLKPVDLEFIRSLAEYGLE